jgi:hypothetical protein
MNFYPNPEGPHPYQFFYKGFQTHYMKNNYNLSYADRRHRYTQGDMPEIIF